MSSSHPSGVAADSPSDVGPDFVPSDGSADGATPSVFYSADTYDSEPSVGYLMRRIVYFLGQDIDRAMVPYDLTNAQWVPLKKLHASSARTVAELARDCQLDAGAMTRLLDRIEAKGLCRRVRSSEDRRVVNLELTDAGRAAAAEIPRMLCDTQNRLLQGFTQDEWTTLKDLLNRMFTNAEALSRNCKKP